MSKLNHTLDAHLGLPCALCEPGGHGTVSFHNTAHSSSCPVKCFHEARCPDHSVRDFTASADKYTAFLDISPVPRILFHFLDYISELAVKLIIFKRTKFSYLSLNNTSSGMYNRFPDSPLPPLCVFLLLILYFRAAFPHTPLPASLVGDQKHKAVHEIPHPLAWSWLSHTQCVWMVLTLGVFMSGQDSQRKSTCAHVSTPHSLSTG